MQMDESNRYENNKIDTINAIKKQKLLLEERSHNKAYKNVSNTETINTIHERMSMNDEEIVVRTSSLYHLKNNHAKETEAVARVCTSTNTTSCTTLIYHVTCM